MDETLRGSGEGWGHWHFAPGGGRPFKLNYTSRGGCSSPPPRTITFWGGVPTPLPQHIRYRYIVHYIVHTPF